MTAAARASGREHRLVWLGIGLAALLHVVRTRRFAVLLITGVVGVAALAVVARENQARNLARVAAWDRRRRRGAA
jgi:hypothetical protein